MYPLRAAGSACLFLVLGFCARAASVSDPAALNANGFISWTQLRAPGSVVPSSFNVQTSSGLSVSGLFFSGDSGTAAKVCPSPGCNFAGAPGFQPGDSLLWAEDASGNGAGSLQLTFATPIQGAGFYLQTGAPSVFTANLFAGSALPLSIIRRPVMPRAIRYSLVSSIPQLTSLRLSSMSEVARR
jgi:hypothetical protein